MPAAILPCSGISIVSLAAAAITGRGAGAGGLALVVQAVRKYDGRMAVNDSDLGGAFFSVRIGELS